MIEKLKEHDVIDPKTDKVIGKIGCDLREIMDKLNELVDAVNGILDYAPLEMAMKAEPADPYAEQRKALDKAKWWLHEIVENHRYTPISTAEMALKEITALEQKEHFADASKTIEQKDVK